jgi:uncharacterized membrane protein YgcG
LLTQAAQTKRKLKALPLNLTTDKAALTDSVNSLNAQVASLTQQVNTLITQTQAQIVAIGTSLPTKPRSPILSIV